MTILPSTSAEKSTNRRHQDRIHSFGVNRGILAILEGTAWGQKERGRRQQRQLIPGLPDDPVIESIWVRLRYATKHEVATSDRKWASPRSQTSSIGKQSQGSRLSDLEEQDQSVTGHRGRISYVE
ncbi:hypothetical protein MPTK1_7g03600 [Marchantia polymorpha subsp. ruderalis]|uniref:Uncharacterized protein n=2 Tax=Marchantia polymorpha TaxID=3197 RepID=A0AAF6BVT7_MARPO|nr:hypothetical protein MARPO_0074s0036 [Marchantia polymorpha]BBN16121.1 hypothetical protein Mp_7g03600 [Marchantia polymorpha subsp. ruderalis]|eukprot:PTQ35044.1 hypothetical protein MARPO_0074s0036 [Marchantia polymorpha]